MKKSSILISLGVVFSFTIHQHHHHNEYIVNRNKQKNIEITFFVTTNIYIQNI